MITNSLMAVSASSKKAKMFLIWQKASVMKAAKSAVAGLVNDKIVDLSHLQSGDKVTVYTKKDPESLEVLRHSAAHLMADAILRLFPKAELTIGPVVEDGFYYDIYLPEGKITTDDFPKIEKEMQRIVKHNHPYKRCSAGER